MNKSMIRLLLLVFTIGYLSSATFAGSPNSPHPSQRTLSTPSNEVARVTASDTFTVSVTSSLGPDRMIGASTSAAEKPETFTLPTTNTDDSTLGVYVSTRPYFVTGKTATGYSQTR